MKKKIDVSSTQYLSIVEKEQCTGCSACAQICPKLAIRMLPDLEGFLYPYLNKTLCSRCNLCRRICPQLGDPSTDRGMTEVFCGSLTDGTLKESASGGAAYAISVQILANHGTVFGTAYVNRFKDASVIAVREISSMEALRGSKYIQGDKGHCFSEIEKELQTNKPVCYIALPCEIAGLKNYLRREYINLLTVELVCFGPTSPRVAEQYIEQIETQEKSQIVEFNTRYKEEGWVPPFLYIELENGKKIIEKFYQTAYSAALEKFHRPSCYHCHFKGDNTQADLTIGDFWGIDLKDPRYNQYGVSILVAHSERGFNMLKKLSGFTVFPATYEEVIRHNPMIEYCPPIGVRTRFAKNFVQSELQIAYQREHSVLAKIQRKLEVTTKNIRKRQW